MVPVEESRSVVKNQELVGAQVAGILAAVREYSNIARGHLPTRRKSHSPSR